MAVVPSSTPTPCELYPVEVCCSLLLLGGGGVHFQTFTQQRFMRDLKALALLQLCPSG